jgi:hypothetical protein
MIIVQSPLSLSQIFVPVEISQLICICDSLDLSTTIFLLNQFVGKINRAIGLHSTKPKAHETRLQQKRGT